MGILNSMRHARLRGSPSNMQEALIHMRAARRTMQHVLWLTLTERLKDPQDRADMLAAYDPEKDDLEITKMSDGRTSIMIKKPAP